MQLEVEAMSYGRLFNNGVALIPLYIIKIMQFWVASFECSVAMVNRWDCCQ
jgi:hypothetical protein